VLDPRTDFPPVRHGQAGRATVLPATF